MLVEMIPPIDSPDNYPASAMTAEQAAYDLQWRPIALAETRQERYERQRAARAEHQRQREETVLFMQSLLCMTLCFVGLVSLTVLL